MADLLDRITGRSQLAAAKLSVKSALNPLLWMCGLISLPCFVIFTTIVETHPDLILQQCILLLVGGSPMLTACIIAIYFSINKPEKLQSEEYQIRHEAMELIKEKESDIIMLESSLEAVVNPVISAIGGNNE